MTLAEMRAALKATLDTVPGIGRTYDYWVRTQHEAETIAAFKADGRLHTWLLTLADDESFSERRMVGCSRVTGRFWIHGYYSLSESGASEKDFETVLQAVITTFRADQQLGGSAIDSGPMRVRQWQHVGFCGVTCHYVQLEIDVLSQVGTV